MHHDRRPIPTSPTPMSFLAKAGLLAFAVMMAAFLFCLVAAGDSAQPTPQEPALFGP